MGLCLHFSLRKEGDMIFFFLVKTWGSGMEKGTRQMEFIQKVSANQRQGLGDRWDYSKMQGQRYQSLGKLPKAVESEGGG